MMEDSCEWFIFEGGDFFFWGMIYFGGSMHLQIPILIMFSSPLSYKAIIFFN